MITHSARDGMLAAGGGLFLVFFIVALVIFGPLLTIWCINTLWGTETPFTFWTWLAALLIGGVFAGSNRSR